MNDTIQAIKTKLAEVGELCEQLANAPDFVMQLPPEPGTLAERLYNAGVEAGVAAATVEMERGSDEVIAALDAPLAEEGRALVPGSFANRLFARAFLAQLDTIGAPNFLTMEAGVDGKPSVELTIRRIEGKSTSEVIGALRARVAELEAQAKAAGLHLKVWTYDLDEGDFFVAESAEEAAQMYREWVGCEPEADGNRPVVWVSAPEDKALTVAWENGCPLPCDPERTECERPAYFAAKYGKGYLFSMNT